ncbi:MAG: hypothetical protein KatS3mg131_3080 [Candidatus Tectimicrobiota bacterium]|nr:MAG: hypothetical protein KatS3mg131_3080 [Candidatus Tectomicrobia bacterium]
MRLIGLVLRAIGVGLRFLRDVLFGVFSLVFLAGLALLGYQAFVWLRDGAWPALPLSLVLDAVPALSRWLREPQSWFGLHELLSGTLALAPLALVCLVLGFAGALLLECCEAPRQRLRSLWHFCNTPLVVFALFAVFLSSLVGTWQAQQAAREGLSRDEPLHPGEPAPPHHDSGEPAGAGEGKNRGQRLGTGLGGAAGRAGAGLLVGLCAAVSGIQSPAHRAAALLPHLALPAPAPAAAAGKRRRPAARDPAHLRGAPRQRPHRRAAAGARRGAAAPARGGRDSRGLSGELRWAGRIHAPPQPSCQRAPAAATAPFPGRRGR